MAFVRLSRSIPNLMLDSMPPARCAAGCHRSVVVTTEMIGDTIGLGYLHRAVEHGFNFAKMRSDHRSRVWALRLTPRRCWCAAIPSIGDRREPV
jgi:hypothetical protein